MSHTRDIRGEDIMLLFTEDRNYKFLDDDSRDLSLSSEDISILEIIRQWRLERSVFSFP